MIKNYTPVAVVVGGALIALGLYFGLQQAPSPALVVPEGLIRAESPPDELVLTERIVNRLEIHIEDIQQVCRSIEEAFLTTGGGTSGAGFTDIAGHANEVVGLAQKIRLVTADMPRRDSQMARLLINRIQHAAHELEDAAEARDHQESHHAFENLEHEVESLEDVVKDMASTISR